MKKGNKVALGIYDSREEVERAVETLKQDGFRNTDVSVLMPQMGDTITFAHEKETKAPEGAAVGSGTGAIIGGTLGWLVGIGAISVLPALGPFIAAGPLVSALSGVAVGGAIGGLTGTLIGLGIPEYEAKRFEGFIQQGGILLSVHADDRLWIRKAEDVLRITGARDIACTTESSTMPRPERRNHYPPESSTSIYP